jgi:hypothetical protein
VTEITPSITIVSPILRVKTNMAVPPCYGEEVPRGWVSDHDRGDSLTETFRVRAVRSGAAVRPGLPPGSG